MSESKITEAILEAKDYCPVSRWKDKQDRAIGLLTAHILTLRWLQIGAIAATSVQNAKGKFTDVPMYSDAWFNCSVYGQQFMQLRRSIVVSGFVI